MTANASRSTLAFQLVDLGGDGFPTARNEAFDLLMDQAMSGGDGTERYVNHVLQFADFASYLDRVGMNAYADGGAIPGGWRATASDGATVLDVDVQLDEELASREYQGSPICGMATIKLELPYPNNLVKIAQFGLMLAEIPAGIIVTRKLWQALLGPLVRRVCTWVQSTVEAWLAVDTPADVSALGDVIADVAASVADDASAEVAELAVEEAVVAELTVDLAAGVPALAALGVLLAVPVLLRLLSKQFVLHFEINNMTDCDFAWSIPYTEHGAMTAQPAASVIPQQGTATDMWGDETSVPVVYQADFTSMNKSGFQGIGWVMRLAPRQVADQDIAAVISVPWIADNVIWLGDPGKNPNWRQLYDDHCHDSSRERVSHGNWRFYASLAIDALHGNKDEYHAVLRIENI